MNKIAVKRRPVSHVVLGLMAAAREAGFRVEYLDDCGGEFLVTGYGNAALAKSLPGALKKLINKLSWFHAHDGHRLATDLINQYEQGCFLP